MANPVLLQGSAHADLRVNTIPVGVKSAGVRNVSVILPEFQHLALNYPIVLTKNPETGAFSCVALFGFEERENLFVVDEVWQALYIPLNVVRGPFMLGTQSETKGDASEHVLLIDVDDERVQTAKGELLFNDRGFPTPYLEKMTSIMRTLKDGTEDTAKFTDCLLEMNLVAPAQLKIEFANGEHREVHGIYTIEPDRLKDLSPEALQRLHGIGYLEAIYAMQLSFGHIRTLIDKKNRRSSATQLK